MPKQKKKYAKCPCCLTDKDSTEISICLSILEKLEKQRYNHYKELGLNTYDSFIDSEFEWACDQCLKERKAIFAGPGPQMSAFIRHLAYFDTELTCRKCNEPFVFKKEEKELWFGKYNMWNFITPNHCLKCRRQLRTLKAENMRLSTLLKKGESEMPVEELNEIAEIYQKWDKTEKVKYYRSVIKKRIKTITIKP